MELLKFIDNIKRKSTLIKVVDDNTYETLFQGTLTELSHSVWFTKHLHRHVANVMLDEIPSTLYWIYIKEL